LRASVPKSAKAAPNGAGGNRRPKATRDKRDALLIADFCNKIGTEPTSR
jgi:hypothetical protein